MRIDNTPWRHVALLGDYRSGLTQATRRGDAQSIRAGLRALLALDRGTPDPTVRGDVTASRPSHDEGDR